MCNHSSYTPHCFSPPLTLFPPILILKGNASEALKLIEGGIDINGISVDGWRPIHVAAQEGHLDCVRVLVENDADVNVQDEVGFIIEHYLR